MSSFIIVGYMWQILGREPKSPPPHPWAALKKPTLNRVNMGNSFFQKTCRKWVLQFSLNIFCQPSTWHTMKTNCKTLNSRPEICSILTLLGSICRNVVFGPQIPRWKDILPFDEFTYLYWNSGWNETTLMRLKAHSQVWENFWQLKAL